MNNSNTLAPKIVRTGEGHCLELRGEVRHQLLNGQDTGGQFALALSDFKYGSGAPLHVHTREDELFFIESGQFHFQIGATKTTLNAGDFVFAPRFVPHSYECSDMTGGSLYVAVVGAGFENFFQEMADRFNEGIAVGPTEMKALATKYGVHMDDFESIETPESLPYILRADEGECLEAFGDCIRLLVPTSATQGRFCLADSQTPALGGPPLHVHDTQTEVFLIRSGRFEFQVGDARVQVGSGDVVFAPSGLPHTFRTISSEPARAFVFVTPGNFEDFFREAKGMFERGEVTPQTMTTLGDKYSIRFLPASA